MDWKKIVSDLEGAGLTQSQIADRAQCSQAYISQLKTGVRQKPDFDTGSALVALHKKRCNGHRRGLRKEARVV